MNIYDEPATYYYTAAGTNTLTQVSAGPVSVFSIHATNLGQAAAAYLQLYDSSSADSGAGTPDYVIPIAANDGTASGTANTATRVYPYGIRFDGGLSLLYSAGATGTSAHDTNAIVEITYRPTAFNSG